MSVTPIQRCLACDVGDPPHLRPFLDLGEQPLANNYHKGEGGGPCYPLAVNVCTWCYHSQLSHSVDPSEMFDHYLYVSGTSETLRRYFEALADRVMSEWEGERPPRVLEIACNDGTLLEMLRERGAEVVGVEPAVNLCAKLHEQNLPYHPIYWSEEKGGWFAGQFDIILAVNVLPHVPDPVGFLKGCRRALAPGGRIYVQTSQCDWLRNGEFDVVYHEHVSYFSANSLYAAARRAGLACEQFEVVPIHSQSFLVRLKPSDDPFRELCGAMGDRMRLDEEEGWLNDTKRYDEFKYHVAAKDMHLAHLFQEGRERGRALVGYGASAKGNTVLNFGQYELDYLVDDNALKWGYQTPGMNIPILAPRVLAGEPRPITFLLTAWNFEQEIVQKIRDQRGTGRGDRVVRYVPHVSVREL